MKISANLIGLVLLASVASAADKPTASEVLERSLRPVPVSYTGHMMVTRWYGSQTKTDDIKVWYRPPHFYRWEFLTPDGRTSRVVLSDGITERTHIVAQNKILKGTAAKSVLKQLVPEKEWALLQANYHLSLRQVEPVAGRQAWVVDVDPKVAGKPSQRLWIDKESGVVLAIKRYRNRGNLAANSRYVRFELNPALAADFFSFEKLGPQDAIEHGYDPEFSSMESFKSKMEKRFHVPETLPMGFLFESADSFVADGHNVNHYRFTDGLSQLSIFETNRPVGFSSQRLQVLDPAAPSPDSLQVQDVGHVLHTKVNGGYLTLIGDISADSLQVISSQLK